MVSIIVAYDDNRLIGNMGQLPWRISDDLKFFKKTTIGHPVIMGHKTWLRLPFIKPLPDRKNIVLTREGLSKEVILSELSSHDGPHYCSDITIVSSLENPFVIGGAQVYELALKLGVVDRVIVSKIRGSYQGDVYFPLLLESRWACDLVEEFEEFDVLEFTKKK